jgi:hypothetical protein
LQARLLGIKEVDKIVEELNEIIEKRTTKLTEHNLEANSLV